MINVNCLCYSLLLKAENSCRNTAVRYKGMKEIHCMWKFKEFDCDKPISVARDFLLFYFKKYLHGKRVETKIRLK